MIKHLFLYFFLIGSFLTVKAQNKLPMIGAEVFIEPGQTSAEIDTWFKKLSESGMTITRIRMTEQYMHKPDGSWDFSLFDEAFKAGDKYNVKIYANFFPATTFADLGGYKFPQDEANLKSIALYIKVIIGHFKQYKSLYGWVPLNEIGSGVAPKNSFGKAKFAEWENLQPVPNYQSNGYVHFDFSDERFLLDYDTWYLNWLSNEIRKYDPINPIHINSHGIFQNVAEYNFPEWRKSLTSLGGSAHPSWHFGYFKRDDYTLAMSANSEIIRSGAGNIPWFMTEIQGGNNTYSTTTPICPTAEEITQWLWMVLGTEGQGAIFWCLNPRGSGREAGEWAMLNYHNEPSDRMLAAAKIIKTINKDTSTFANVKEVESGINVLYIRESLWVEKKLQTDGVKNTGSEQGGVMKSAIAYFTALTENGVQANFKEIGEFDFSKNDYKGVSIILAHQISVPSVYWSKLESFVQKGGKLIADGLFGYYDENAVALSKTGFPLRNLLGGDILEYKAIDSMGSIRIDKETALPMYQWKGIIQKTSGEALASQNGEILALQHSLGQGKVYWIPTLAGLGSRINDDYTGLGRFLKKEIGFSSSAIPFSFKTPQKNLVMKIIKSGDDYITILANTSSQKREINLNIPLNKNQPEILFSNKQGSVSKNLVIINPEETLVIKWFSK